MTAGSSELFINCPFDAAFRPLFEAIVFSAIRCGFVPRCALEVSDSASVRVDRIAAIIAECDLGIHDLSRTGLDHATGLPRFNMPFELGLFLGARYFGGRRQKSKSCLILDTDRYRYQAFISDIAGQDVEPHGNDIEALIASVRNFLNHHSGPVPLPGGEDNYREWTRFRSAPPAICADLKIAPEALGFRDLCYTIELFISFDVFG